ncbi:MAG: ATP synthase F0 subunit B [Deltaproteobacteria bacterium]|nr:ATP synthase F0 subunit B [Deltaproteobacteria bacterium]
MELSLLYKWINFILFSGALVYLLRDPLRVFLGNRREILKKEIEEITRERLKIESHFQSYRKKLAEAGNEIQKLTEDLRKEGELEKQSILQKAKEYVEKIKKDAAKVGEQELNKTRLLLKKKTLLTAVEHAKDLLEKLIGPKDHERLVGGAIQNLEKKELGAKEHEGSHLS